MKTKTSKKNELGYTFNQVWSHIAKELENNYEKLNLIQPKQQNYGNVSAISSVQSASL
jgi:hypothetical protein